MDERLKNVSQIVNENQKMTIEKFGSSEEQLNILQATVIAQVENQFLPQVVGEVFTTATQLVKEGIFHDRLLFYAPGAIEQAEQYYLKKVKFVSCQELPIDQNLITINVTMILPVVDLRTNLFEHQWLDYTQGDWLVTTAGSPYTMTTEGQSFAINLPANHASPLITKPTCLPENQSWRIVKKEKIYEPLKAMITSNEYYYV